jgi:hypothetical protein
MKRSVAARTMVVWLQCPLCGSRIPLNRLRRHRNRAHPAIPIKALERAIESSLANGTLKHEIIGGGTTIKSSTQAFEAGRKMGYYGGPLRGGAVELGKRR